MSIFARVPRALRNKPRWVVYRDSRGDDMPTPLNPKTLENAILDNEETWGTFEEAVETHSSFNNPYNTGIGYVLAKGEYSIETRDYYKSIQKDIVEIFQSYSESTGHSSVQTLIQTSLDELDDNYYMKNPNNGIEIHGAGHIFCFSCNGSRLERYGNEHKSVKDCTNEFKDILERFMRKQKQMTDIEILFKEQRINELFSEFNEFDKEFMPLVSLYTQRDENHRDNELATMLSDFENKYKALRAMAINIDKKIGKFYCHAN